MNLIDVDEAGVFPETSTRHYGKAYYGIRSRSRGAYGHSEKFTLLAAVAANGDRWFSPRKIPGKFFWGLGLPGGALLLGFVV